MTAEEQHFMEATIEAARKSKADPTGKIPRVGAVAVLNKKIIGVAFRGQDPAKENDHAEFNLLENAGLKDVSLVDATIYTSLEPCTHRGPNKTPCVDRLINRKVGRVVIGMLDPNPIIRGVGFRRLRAANVPTEVFPHKFMSQLEDLNRFFISRIENDVVTKRMQEMGVLVSRCRDPRQSVAAEYHLEECLQNLRRIESGEIPIIGQEAAFFEHWLERARRYKDTQNVRAYIRLPAFKPEELLSKNWFEDFYQKLSDMVASDQLRIKYIYLLPTQEVTPPIEMYLDKIKRFADEIRIIRLSGRHLAPEDMRPSLVLFDTQKFAFTHDRADNAAMLQASEWISTKDMDRHTQRYRRLEMASEVYYNRA
jgi:pyrimidine deaminase RibD-like protein